LIIFDGNDNIFIVPQSTESENFDTKNSIVSFDTRQ